MRLGLNSNARATSRSRAPRVEFELHLLPGHSHGRRTPMSLPAQAGNDRRHLGRPASVRASRGGSHLFPRQAVVTPAVELAPVEVLVGVALEAVQHVDHLGEAGGLQHLGRGNGALA